MNGVNGLVLFLATYLMSDARATSVEAKDVVPTLPVQIGFNTSSGVWYSAWNQSLSRGSRLIFSNCEGSEVGSFVLKEDCASVEVTGLSQIGDVLLRAELRGSGRESLVQRSLYAFSVDFYTTESAPLPSEFELTPGECFQSRLFSGSVNCFTDLQAYVLVDGVGSYVNVFSPLLPHFVSYHLSADNTELSLCLASNVLSHLNNVRSSVTIQEVCMRQASHTCSNENDDQIIVHYGNRGTLYISKGLPDTKCCIFSVSETSETQGSSATQSPNTPASDSTMGPSALTDATNANEDLRIYIPMIVGATVFLFTLGILFLLLFCIVTVHKQSSRKLTRPSSMVYKNGLTLSLSMSSRADRV